MNDDGSVVFKMRVLGTIGYRVPRAEVIAEIQGKPETLH